ncbi:ADP-ribose glycohydrolase MACROD2 isoform X11 [Mus musculus]|uniref:ADP-ribose glycohydrolase MACROD2 isoform X11 n=1 Tax=Mus musculus TaxID=10090 RepID=UPI0003D75A03|nr:ADP-ribose glycohydrolase MACROD2 isoform X11 [Mus musculus]|eukprot:XP_006500314.1 PREDICTED: O-acetyl-ADP-ribose deacetylase MACROD2 isoform X8 [Mus musculus]
MYPSNKKKKVWREEKERLLKMTLEERRKEYIRDYVSLSTILSWKEEMKSKGQNDEENTQEAPQMKKSLSEKVSLYRGDITLLEVDAIVNAANASLLGGGGVDGCIHRAAGPCLLAECRNLNGCETGHAKITCGYDLPAKYVIHTVGPIARGHINGSHKEDLANCYQSSLKLVKENNLRSVAFPCISTGIYGFPNEPAAVIALGTIKEWLAKNHQEVDRIIFCVFLEVDFKIYKKKMNEFFPVDDNNEGTDADMKEDSDESGPEEKQTAEEMEGQSQEADGVNTTPVPSPASEDKAEVHKDEADSAKDDNTVKDSDMTNHSVCDQELPNGQENDSAKSEGKTEAESPSSSMETEDLSPNQEDAAIVEQPEVIPLIDDQEAQEGGEAQGKDAPAVFAESQGSSEAENTSGPDVDMNSQVDGVNEPTESLQEDLQ